MLGLAVVAGAVAVLAALVLCRHPVWALTLWAVIEVTNAGEVLAGITRISLANPAMLLATVSVGAALWRRSRSGALGRPPGDLKGGLLVAGLGVLFFVAQLPALVIDDEVASLLTIAPDLVRSLVFLALAVLTGTYLASPWLLVKILVVPLGVIGGLTFLNFAVFGGLQPLGGFAAASDALGEGAATPRYGGPLNDPNVWGRALVLAVPFAVTLAVRALEERRSWHLVWWTGIGAGLLLGTYLTQSRGAMLALAVAAVVWWCLSGPKPRLAKVAVPVAGVALLAVPGVGSRILSLGQLIGGDRVTDGALVERAAAQRVAFEVFRDHPLLGVGDPQLYFREYAQYADIVLTRLVSPHNLYLQLAASGGVVLLLTYLCLVGVALVVCVRICLASRHLDGTGSSGEARLLAAAAAGSLAGWTVCSLFLHMNYPRHVLLVLGLVSALALTTRSRPLAREELDPREGQRIQLLLVRAAVVGVVLGTAMLAAPWVARVTDWGATVTVVVLPQEGAEGVNVDGYQYDIVTRTVVVPTYAAVFSDIVSGTVGTDDDVVVTATGDAEEAVVTIGVLAPDEATALVTARRAAREGSAYLNAQPALSTLAVARPGPAAAAEVTSLDDRRLALLLGSAIVLGLAGAMHPSWRRLASTRPVESADDDLGQPLAPSSR